MNRWCRNLLVGATLGVAVWTLAALPVQADDDYWRAHWNWYDGTYRPYHERNYETSVGGGSYHAPRYYDGNGVPMYDHIYRARRPYTRTKVSAAQLRYGWW